MAKANPDEPTLDEYVTAFDNPKSVPRAKLLKALKRFERLDYRAL